MAAVTARTAQEPTSLDDLWRNTQHGSSSSFAELYDQLSPAVYGIALHLLRDPGLAEAACCAALVQVWVEAPLAEVEAGNVKGWVCSVAHRCALDLARSCHSDGQESAPRRRESISALAAHSGAAILSGPRPERSAVADGLRQLSSAARQTIELAYLEGQTCRQLADVLEIPVDRVTAHMSDGLQQLRTILDATD